MDANAALLARNVNNLIRTRYHGNQQEAFNAYAGRNGEVNKAGVERLLSDADVGNFITRGRWADGVMDRFDTGPKNGAISWAEFQAGMAAANR